VKFAGARQFVAAVAAHDLEAAKESLDPDVETVTPRGRLRGIEACRQVLQKASGNEQFAMEQAEAEFEVLRATSLPGRMRSLVGVKLAKSRMNVACSALDAR
jgi:hypothetical protein